MQKISGNLIVIY